MVEVAAGGDCGLKRLELAQGIALALVHEVKIIIDHHPIHRRVLRPLQFGVFGIFHLFPFPFHNTNMGVFYMIFETPRSANRYARLDTVR
jgi:hypothetical protein